jgi:hypothetical protein
MFIYRLLLPESNNNIYNKEKKEVDKGVEFADKNSENSTQSSPVKFNYIRDSIDGEEFVAIKDALSQDIDISKQIEEGKKNIFFYIFLFVIICNYFYFLNLR